MNEVPPEGQEQDPATLVLDARALALAQTITSRGSRGARRVHRRSKLDRALAQARRQYLQRQAGTKHAPSAVAWLLDNEHLFRLARQQMRADLVPRAEARLPRVQAGIDRGLARVDALAHWLIGEPGLRVDLPSIRRFVDAYQEVVVLTVAELAALPTMLRRAVLWQLVRTLNGPRAEDGGVDVERSVRALRVLDGIDWGTFFQKVSRVEHILEGDPAGAYAQMEAGARRSYRAAVEVLARGSDEEEHAIASRAIALAKKRRSPARRAHVGYYLVAEGRPLLERRIGYRPDVLARVRRALLGSPTLFSASALGVLSVGQLLALGVLLAPAVARAELGPGELALLLSSATGPTTALALALLRFTRARLLRPPSVPRLAWPGGIPESARTLVIIRRSIHREADVASALAQLDRQRLANPDPQLVFAIVTDGVNAGDRAVAPPDAALHDLFASGLEAMRARETFAPSGQLHWLHRAQASRSGERQPVAPRRRGLLDDLNRLLRGHAEAADWHHVGNAAELCDVRFVITLDEATQLPLGTAKLLVGALAHPLNQASFDPATGEIVAGYAAIRPLIATSPSEPRETPFARFFAQDDGVGAAARPSRSEDLFGTGSSLGKIIYEIDALRPAVAANGPVVEVLDDARVSGVHGHTAFADDIVVYQARALDYRTFARRRHDRIGADWRALPAVFAAGTAGASTAGARLERGRAVERLWRTLDAPLLFSALAAGFWLLGGDAWRWALGILCLSLGSTLLGLVGHPTRRRRRLGRAVLSLVFLAYEAALALDAIVRAASRALRTRRGATGASEAQAGATSGLVPARWLGVLVSPAVALVGGSALASHHRSAFAAAMPLLLAWLFAPAIAAWLGRPDRQRGPAISSDDRRRLRLLARRTWRFFDAFVGPTDQWLPVDNHQEAPHEQTAHRTSPTNIGLTLLATLSAYDFGYLGQNDLSLRLTRAFESIARLAHHRGHLLNWYDSQSLVPLEPRYVSTVDSGNFAGSLLALAQGCRDVVAAPLLRAEAWEGLGDAIDLLAEVVAALPVGTSGALITVLTRLEASAARGRDHLEESATLLATLVAETAPALDRELLAVLEAGTQRHEADLLLALRTSIARLHQQLIAMRRELTTSLPWLELGAEASLHGVVLPSLLPLAAIPAEAARLRAALATSLASGDDDDERRRAARVLDEALAQGDTNARASIATLLGLAERAEREASAMRFGLLYDEGRRLLRIGYDVSADALDPGCYDLLASEARLASYLAIVQGDVPADHWQALGRPLVRVHGEPVLVSWAGTMFEYLMPGLLMRSRPGTLLERSSRGAVQAQIDEGKKRGTPWGMSESAYAMTDTDGTYQYRAFGVAALALQRTTGDDLVVAPYASLLAVSLRPDAVLTNLARLDAAGMMGPFGLYEALDLTPARAPSPSHAARDEARPSTIVRSYMAHHQGMLLVSLGNFLHQRSMVDRFHDHARVQVGEPLLDEPAPRSVPRRSALRATPHGAAPGDDVESAIAASPASWLVQSGSAPEAFVLGNGRLSCVLTSSGGGGLRWNKLALTRYQASSGRDEEGIWLYVRDEETRRLWRASSRQGQTTFAAHQVELHQRCEGISVRVAVAVTPTDDVEIRRITLHNESGRSRRLGVTSAGRPVLFDAVGAPAHPAFSGLFVESEWVEELEALVFTRRAQTPEEVPAVLVHRLVHEGRRVALGGYESDRGRFCGRGGDPSLPAALSATADRLVGEVGAVLDPIMSVQAQIALAPGESATFAYVTTVARSRSSAVSLARKYGSMHAVRWAFRDAERETRRRLARTGVGPGSLPSVQRLCTALLFPRSVLGAPCDARAEEAPQQERLWGRRISGDDPLVVFFVHDPAAPLLTELVAAHRYLGSSGVVFELVLIDEHVGGYASDAPGTVRHALAQLGVLDEIDRRGGIFVIQRDQIDDRERQHLTACARVLVQGDDTSLTMVLDRRDAPRVCLPPFVATLQDTAPSPPLPSRTDLLFDQGLGGFSADGSTYVIDVAPEAPPPAPWCNVLANADFGCLVSESALGMSWSLNSGENRLTPWANDPVHDVPAEALYLRDEETAAVWTPTRLPAGRDAPTRVRHGAGYTVYERESHGLRQRMTVFVPPGASLKVVHLQLRNTLPRPRRLTATYAATWVLGSRVRTHVPHITTDIDRAHACLLATSSWSAELSGRVAFLTSRHEVHGFTNDFDDFLGPDGDPSCPDGLLRWGLSGSVEGGARPAAVLQAHLEIAAGEQVETHFVLGQAGSKSEALAQGDRYRQPAVVDAALAELHVFWDGILGAIRVSTPDPAMNLLLDRWLLYQSLSSRVFGRTGFYQSSGAFGYRDQLQDVLALLQIAPALARAHIVEAARHQFEAGDVLHWWHPPSGRGVRTRCSDDLAWLPYVVCEYVAVTGDASLLDEEVPYLVGAALRPTEHDRYARFVVGDERASVLDHCLRALQRAATSGAHGLPLMGAGDWNDGMSRMGVEGRGESVWLAWFLRATMQKLADLLEARGAVAEAMTFRTRAEALGSAVDEAAWDGAWYLRAFHDDGSLVGSAQNQECRLDSIAQSWAALSGGPNETPSPRARAAVLAAHEALVRPEERLVRLFWPPFDHTTHDPGYIAAYPPGVRENGGQYTHAAAWLGLAHVALGDGARAEQIFSLLNPIRRALSAEDVARYRVEPYALAADVYGAEPWVGRGGWTFYTGAAAWLWRLGVEGILGLQRVGGQLRIAPCIPPHWPGFEAWIRFGKQTVHVVVENPDHVAKGVRSIRLDGAVVDGPRLQLEAAASGTREVVVRLGEPDVRDAASTALVPAQAGP